MPRANLPSIPWPVLTGLIVLLLVSTTSRAIELDEAYRFLGQYRIIASGGVRLYYPAACQAMIPRILASFQETRARMIRHFPDQQGFEATVLLTNHDDRESASLDATFDLVTLGMYEEMDSLSTRSYSLPERFALRLAYTLIMRTLGSARTAIQRKIGLLSIPPWFLEGLALYYAFPLDVLQITRLHDLVRHHHLYNIEDLDTMQSRAARQREEMSFQVHSMMDFWHRNRDPDAGLGLLRQIRGRPGQFADLFKKTFGTSLKEGFQRFRDEMNQQCQEQGCASMTLPKPAPDWGTGEYAQSARTLPDGTKIWVSSQRYTEEVYDLWSRPPGKRPRLILRNVHPALLVDPASGTIFIGRFELTVKRQRRLFLWEIAPGKAPRRLVDRQGCFKPLGFLESPPLREPAGECFGPTPPPQEPASKAAGRQEARPTRLFFLNLSEGTMRLLSVNPRDPKEIREEFCFSDDLRPLEVALDPQGRRIVFVLHEGERSLICRLPLVASGPATPEVIHAATGAVGALQPIGDELFFTAEADFQTLQLFSWREGRDPALTRLSAVPGGVWDFTPADDGRFLATTFLDGRFRPVHLPAGEPQAVPANPIPFPDRAPPEPVTSRPYRAEFLSSYWLPKATRDDRGGVLGVYSYRADRLDRSRIVVSPTFGLKSRDFGYLAQFQRRFDLWRVNLNAEERVVGKSYLSNSYYERVRSFGLSLSYPFNLSTAITFGGDFTHRGIAKFPDNGGTTPSVGRDHSIYGFVAHQAIRTEPFWELFPRKGRRITAAYRKGLDLFNGQLKYDSFSLRWEEYIPLGGPWVLTARTWLAEDDKEGGIRRPDDLNLGGSDYLRGYPGSVRYGDSLRAYSLHLSRPIRFSIPALHRWVQEEIIVPEIFWERGDVRFSGRSFDFLEDRGFEVRARGLILRRIPITVRWGTAWPGDGRPRHSYWAMDISAVTGLIH